MSATLQMPAVRARPVQGRLGDSLVLVRLVGLLLVAAVCGGIPAASAYEPVPSSPCSTPVPTLPDTLDALLARARDLLENAKRAEADTLARRALEIAEADPGLDSFYVAKALDIAVRSAEWPSGGDTRSRGRDVAPLAIAEEARRAVRLKETRFGPDHAEVAMSLDVLGFVLSRLEPPDRTGAEAAYRRALGIRERCLGPDHPEVGTSYLNLARLFTETPADSLAEPYIRQAIAMLERSPDDPQLARALLLLANRFVWSSTPEAAVEPAQRALTIYQDRYGSRHYRVQQLHGQLGYALIQSGQIEQGLVHLQRARAIAADVFGVNSRQFAAATWNLGGGYAWFGDRERGMMLSREAIAIRVRLDPTQRDLGDLYRMLADGLVGLGEYAAAKDTLELAVRMEERDFGKGAGAIPMMNLADLLEGPLGNPDEAIPIAERAFEDYLNVLRPPGDLGPRYEIFDRGLRGILARCYLGAGDTARARPLVDELTALLDRHAESTELNLLLERVGHAAQLRDLGRFDEARDRLAAVIRTFERAYPSGHPNLALAMLDMADLECRTGHPDEAERLLASTLARQEQVIGGDHPQVAHTLLALARVQALRGERDTALANALRAESVGRDHARLVMQTLSERRALAYAGARGSAVPLLTRLALDAGRADVVRRAWDEAARSRALVLDELAERRRHAANAGGCAAEYAEASTDLARLIVSGSGEKLGLERYAELLEQARRKSEEAEEQLARSCTPFRAGRERRRAGLAAAAAALPEGAALVSYVRVPAEALTARQGLVQGRAAARVESPDMYVAFVLASTERAPEVVEIGSAAYVDSLVEAWRRLVRIRPSGAVAERRCRDAGVRLCKAVWDPVAQLAEGAQRVFVVPDGALNLVNIAALPDTGDRYLIESGPGIHLLSAERDLTRWEKAPLGRGLLAIGAPAFDVRTASTMMLPASGGGGDALAGEDGLVYRRSTTGCADFRALRFDPLPATAHEIDDVVAVWVDRMATGAERFTGAAASEAVFKHEAGACRVVHVATHGFFVGGACTPSSAGSRGIGRPGGGGRPLPAAVENPLLLSGLAFAGANRRDESGPNDEDGILTAEEIASLDLSGVEWAVLSACETGVGEVRAGEGVFGLRRAFQVAGARTLIMSLWAVEDEATRAWMGHLYRARLEEKKDTAESVREASLAVLAERRAKGESTHPFYWGAFVAAGDWR